MAAGTRSNMKQQHDNIVKYIGFVKSADCLNIILELVSFVPFLTI